MSRWPHRLGTARYFQCLGQAYAEMFRGSMTASGVVTAAAAWLGMSKTGALILGAGSLLFWQALALGFGYLVWRWRLIHAQLRQERDNNPAVREQLDLLREIAGNTRLVAPPGGAYDTWRKAHAARGYEWSQRNTWPPARTLEVR